MTEFVRENITKSILNKDEKEVKKFIENCLFYIEEFRNINLRHKSFAKIEIIKFVRNKTDYSLFSINTLFDLFENLNLIHINLGRRRFKPSYDKIANTEDIFTIIKHNISIKDLYTRKKLTLI